MRPYSIFTPPFDTTSGGIRVMYGLYGWLLAKGQIVHLNAQYANPDFVAIYPEIQEGNPAGANTVVRYILNKPGRIEAVWSDGTVKTGPTDFGENDKLYYFSRLFGEADEDHYLFLPILNTHLFKDYGNKRTKTAYFVGKGMHYFKPEDINKHPKDAILIDRQLADDQQKLADILNECELLYCYDPVTAMTELARLCGCEIVMIPSIYTREEFEKYEPGMDGIRWGTKHDPAIYDMSTHPLSFNSEKFATRYKAMVDQFSKNLDKFIEDTQK